MSKHLPHETKVCPWCKAEFITNLPYKLYCCKDCRLKEKYHNESLNRPKYPQRAHQKKAITDRPFTDDTNTMIVSDAERYGSFKRLAIATMRTEAAIIGQCQKLKESGEYDIIKQIVNTAHELPRYQASCRIA